MFFSKKALFGGMLLLGLSSLTWGQTVAGGNESSAVLAGKERFIDACAFCHGLTGQGDGMAADMLENQPADLTVLSKANDGRFPLTQVYAVIDGRTGMDSHGPRDMPVWGDVWSRNVPAEYAEYYVKGRILELILFMESIQQ